MKNSILRKLGVAVTVLCLCLAVGASQAAPLITFTNGAVADADDVNANFNELATRIDNIPAGPAGAQGNQGPIGATGMTGPAGPQGLPGVNGADGAPGATGPQGPAGPAGTNGTNGADGAGVVTYPWAGYAAAAWDEKVFIVTHSAGTWDKEVQTFVRTPLDVVTGTAGTIITRQRTKTGVGIVKHHVLHYTRQALGDFLFNLREDYVTDGTNVALGSTYTITPGFKVRHNAMGVGMNWGTASTITKVDIIGGGASDATEFGIDSRSLLAIEDITVQGVDYVGCQKILNRRAANGVGGAHESITWYCPNNVGMVKQIQIDTRSSPLVSWVLEFDPTQSIPAAP